MRSKKRFMSSIVLLILALLGLTLVASASAPFVEPDVALIHTFTGESADSFFGWVAENLGDINGDSVNDFIVSDVVLTVDDQPAAGKVYIYSGSDGALLNAVTGSTFQLLGHSASTAGDVNNDGVPDYVVGAPGLDVFDFNTQVTGTAKIYSGVDHTLLFELSGEAGTAFGASVTGAGDVNGDGYDDVIVGEPKAGADTGRVYVYSGQDGSLLWSRDGLSAGSRLGSAVGLVGDVTGDGLPDQVAGARAAGKKGRGEAYAFSGSDGTILYTMKPVGRAGTNANGDPFPTFGQYFASGAGDINNDGTPDIFVGDYNAWRGNTSGTGRAYVFSGVDGTRLHIFNAENKGDGFGPGRGTGDVNGDGYGDLIIGAYTYSDVTTEGGKAYVYSGSDGAIIRTMTGNVEGQQLGVDALAVGDINGDGLVDYLITGSGVVHVVAGIP